jgi:hypothetical protein
MAFTQADVDAIDRAIASGEKSVQIDGKLIVNDTIEALEKRKAHILACLRNGSSGTSTARSRGTSSPRSRTPTRYEPARLDHFMGEPGGRRAPRAASARARLLRGGEPEPDAQGTHRTGHGEPLVGRGGRNLREQARYYEQNFDIARGVLADLVLKTVGPTASPASRSRA